jgi:hypothetical protein
MALVRCPDCATEVSDQAPDCPRSGLNAGDRDRTIVIACLLWLAGVVACNRACPACDATPAASTASTTAPPAPTYVPGVPPIAQPGAYQAAMRDACDNIRIAHDKGGPLAGQQIDELNKKLCMPYWYPDYYPGHTP